MKKLFGPILLFIILPLGALMLLWRNHCEDITMFSVVSPNGQFLAESKETVCQSQSPTATQIFLSKKKDSSWDDEIVILLYKGKAQKSPAWTSEQELTFYVPDDGHVIKHYPEMYGVTMNRIQKIKEKVSDEAEAKTQSGSEPSAMQTNEENN